MEFRAPDHHHQLQDQMRSATSATSTLGFTHQAADRRRSLVSAAHNGNNTSTMTTTTNTTTPSGCTNTNTQTLDARPLQQVQPARVKYRECLKNHAASAGGSVFDGCGEFMPSGEDGSLEALKCAACTCHRNFHRKDLDGGGGQLSIYSHITPPPPPPLVQPMNVAYGGGGVTESSSEELNANSTMSKKRFRTKFTREQKDRMLEFAERVGWRFQKQDDELVDQFCSDVGVRRQVLKVWMHNNKSNNLNANHRHHLDHVSILMVNPTTTTTTATTDVVAMNHQASDDDNEEALDP